MKPFISFGFLLSLLSLSCTKENLLPVATLQLRFEDRSSEVEWLEVSGSRYASSNDLYVTANGYDTELFHLELPSISSTGLVTNVTSKNISYSNSYGFSTGGLQSVQIKILSIDDDLVRGSFEATFINKINSTDVIKANGEFSVLGQE